MNIENLKEFGSETEHIAREIIESNEITPQDKLDTADQLRRVANKISYSVALLREQSHEQTDEQPDAQDDVLQAWLKSFRGRPPWA